jgi:hypothetical protein
MEHYLQVTETDFAIAAGQSVEEVGRSGKGKEFAPDGAAEEAQQNAQQQASQQGGKERNGSEQKRENPDDFENRRDSLADLAPPRGLEPRTKRLTAACSTN